MKTKDEIKKGRRYAIVGEWSGPANPAGDFTRYVHREYVRCTSERGRERLESIRKLGSIRYTDGTLLFISIVDVTGDRKLPKANPSYRSLIEDCLRHGVNAVADLPR